MNPFEKIVNKVDSKLHTKLPQKWKKIGDVIILDLSEIDSKQKKEVAKTYADVLNAKTVIQKNIIAGELRKPEKIKLLYGYETVRGILSID